MSLLDIEKLTMRFGGLTAVNQVTLAVEPGQIFSVIGPNGAGKTTVFNAITGIYEPTEGDILFQGKPIRHALNLKTFLWLGGLALLIGLSLFIAVNLEGLWKAAITSNYIYDKPFDFAKAARDAFAFMRGLPPREGLLWFCAGALLGCSGGLAIWSRTRRTPDLIASNGIARTFQNIRLFQQMTVTENVLAGMQTKLRTRFWHILLRLPFYWREHREACRRAMDILEFVDLGTEANHIAKNLCYGDQRRLEIARALAIEPRLLLLDEPAAGMNPSETVDLMTLIRKIRDRGITVLLIEHDMKVVMGISDRIAVLDYGNKIAEGTPCEIKENPRVIEAYLGKEEIA